MLTSITDQTKLVIGIVSATFGLFPALLNLIATYVEKLGREAKRNRELAYVNQRLSFLKNWYELQKGVNEPEQIPDTIKGMVSRDLDAVYRHLSFAMAGSDKLSQEQDKLLEDFKKINVFRRFFLLYKPYNVSGWLFHTLYYMSLIPWLLLIGYEVYQYILTKFWLKDQTYMYVGILLTILVILFRLFGRGAAKSKEHDLATVDRQTDPLRKSTSSSQQ